MKFPLPLIKGRLIKRYKRFLSDIELENGEIVTAHCANSGSMMGLKEPGYEVWLSPANNPKRKLQYTWELVDTGTSLVGINTGLPNKIVSEAIEKNLVEGLEGYETLKNEVKYGENSRIDILLTDAEKSDCYVEVKSVTLSREAGIAEFPDAVTSRGTKHLNELARMVESGKRAAMFYLVQRMDCQKFSIAKDIDPAYFDAFIKAREKGVEIFCYQCSIDAEGITVEKPIHIVE
ncbi:MAG: DNA/RNA nuclease SfsA [Sneathiellales bacterium]|nr:DNA/RNA nuclease SfsA [Sneathiellales bacterium]